MKCCWLYLEMLLECEPWHCLSSELSLSSLTYSNSLLTHLLHSVLTPLLCVPTKEIFLKTILTCLKRCLSFAKKLLGTLYINPHNLMPPLFGFVSYRSFHMYFVFKYTCDFYICDLHVLFSFSGKHLYPSPLEKTVQMSPTLWSHSLLSQADLNRWIMP